MIGALREDRQTRLPHLSPADPSAYIEERTYRSLVSRLGSKTAVSVECRFVDSVADIAVLGMPHVDLAYKEAETCGAMMEKGFALPVAKPGKVRSAWLFSLEGKAFRCDAANHGALWLSNADDEIVGGMSGSPILSEEGMAIGVLCKQHRSHEAREWP